MLIIALGVTRSSFEDVYSYRRLMRFVWILNSENKEKLQLQVDNTHKLKLTVASTADIGISE